MKKLYIVFLLTIIFSSICFSQDNSVMLQGFHWNSWSSGEWWNTIRNNADKIKDAGIDMIWFPPSQSSAAREGYLPNELYKQESYYGSSSELRRCIKELHKNNVKVLADIVINHRVGTFDWGDFKNPEWGTDSVCSDDEWTSATGNWDTGMHYHAARDIDHTKEYVRKDIVKWLDFLKKDIGYDGFRYDFVKGFNGKFIEFYNDSTNPCFSVGEYWDDLNIDHPDWNRQDIVNWIDQTNGKSSAFDFTTKGLLQHAINTGEYYRLKDDHGKPAGIMGWWPEKTVTFLDNHDTGPSTNTKNGQNHWPFPGDRILEGYAYILTHPGIPCIYWPHLFDWGTHNRNEIIKMINIRKSQDISSTSSIKILKAKYNLYSALINNNTIVKIGSENWNPGKGWNLKTSGTNYAIWIK